MTLNNFLEKLKNIQATLLLSHFSHLLESHGLLDGLITIGDGKKGFIGGAHPPGDYHKK